VTSTGTPRTALVFAAFVAILLGAALAFAPRLIDLRTLSPTISAELGRALGQEVALRGDIILSLVPGPQLIIRDVATPAFDGTKLALSVEEIRADLGWRDLLLGRYTIATLKLLRPTIDLPLAGFDASAASQLTLERATLHLHAQERVLIVEGLDAELTTSSSGALSWAAGGVFEGLPLSVEGRLGAGLRDGARSLQMKLELPEADITMEASGALTAAVDFKGRVALSALHAADAVLLTGGAAGRWPWSSAPLKLSAEIETTDQRLAVTSSEMSLGAQIARLSGNAVFDAAPRFVLSVEVVQADMLQWLPTAAAVSAAPPAFNVFGSQPWSGEIKINGTGVSLGAQTARDLAVDLVRDQGAWTVRNAALTLPGQARVSVAGLWTAGVEDEGFTGSWRGDVRDMPGFLAWLGIGGGEVSEQISAFSASGLIQTNARLTVLSDLALSFDATQAKGRIVFGWDAASPFAVELDADRLALDRYGPLLRGVLRSVIGLTPRDASVSGYGVNPLVPWLGNLAVQRGTVRIAVPLLTWRDQLAGPLGIDVAFDNGVIDIRSVAFTDASGAAGWIGGKIRDLSGVPTAESLQFDVRISDPARFARAARSQVPAALRELGPWSLTGALNGSLLDAVMALEGKLGASALSANAKVKFDGRRVAFTDIAVAAGPYGLRGTLEFDDSTQPRTVKAALSEINLDLATFPIIPLPIPGDWQGEVALSGVRFQSSLIDADNFSMRFVASKNAVELAEWSGALYGGAAQVGMKWAKDGSAHTLQGQVVLNEAAALFAAQGKAKADLTVNFSATAPRPEGWLAALTGAGNFKLSVPANAALKPSGVFAPLAAAGQAEGPGNSPVKQEATASFSIENGIAATEDLSVQSNAYGATFKGAVDLARQTFDLKGVLKLRDRGLIAGPSAQLILPPSVPASISGPIAAPTIKLDLSQR